jgi:DNA-binding CsgD family transcriptional regulator
MRRDGLTPREREVAPLVKRNLSDDEIAGTLGIARGTVKMHIHNIRIKREFTRRQSKRGGITPAGRKRISEAQRRRWQRATRSEETKGAAKFDIEPKQYIPR